MKRFWRPASKLYQRFAVLDQAQLRRGAAHVETQQVRGAVASAEERRGQRAGGGAGFQHLHGVADDFGRVGQSAVGQHQQQGRADALGRQTVRQALDVAGGERLDVGAGDGGGDAVELADFRRRLVRGRHMQAGRPASDGLGRLLFVRGVGVRMQEHDADRGRAA
jgi:hypothetical protein